MRSILIYILRILAKQTLRRYAPIVIGITGSVGKTIAKEATYAALNRSFFTWKNSENFNNEIGVPLAVLGIKPTFHKISLMGSMLKAAWYAWGARRKWYPRYLVLELAADRPGDIAYLVDMTKPQIGVITAIGDVPVHVEHYANQQEVAREKARIVEFLPRHIGLAVLNADDQVVIKLKTKVKVPVTTFGFSPTANYRASDVSLFSHDGQYGLSFRVNHGASFMPMRLHGLIAIHQLYGVLVACAIAEHLGMNLVEVADALGSMEFSKSRMRLIPGIRGSTIIDDTYNASPLSMRAALDTLKQIPGKRKIALLGEMAELGAYSEEEHRKADEHAKQCADIVLWCRTSEELLGKVRAIIQEGDLVLVKGSRMAKMEKIVLELSMPPSSIG